MRLRIAILRVEARLVALLVTELFLLNPMVILLLIYFPSYLWLLARLDEGIYLKPIGFYAFILFGAAAAKKIYDGPDEPVPDQPVLDPIGAYPDLQQMVERVARSFHCSSPKQVSIALSPVSWRAFGVDISLFRWRNVGLPLPLGCFGTWSVSELEAFVARVLMHRRGPGWLFKTVLWAIHRLDAEQYQHQVQNVTHWLARARGKALDRYLSALDEWRFLSDLEADLAASRYISPDVLMSLAYKTAMAESLLPMFLTTVVEPALKQRALLCVADAYAAYALAVDPHWLDEIVKALQDLDRDSSSDSGPLIKRLAVLSTLPKVFTLQDPRPATSLLRDYRAAELRAAANELGSDLVESAAKIDMADSVRLAIIPLLKDEVDRNILLLEGKTRFDIPDLLRRKAELAADYRADDRFLFAPVQKESMIPLLLGSFLALALIEEKWEASFELHEGIRLGLAGRCVQPFTLVGQLESGAITEAEFLETVK